MTKTEERKGRALMEMRGYKEIRRSELEGVVELLVKAPRQKETILVWCTSKRVGLGLLRKMMHKMNAVGVKRGIIMGDITRQAQALAKQKGIELIPKGFPSLRAHSLSSCSPNCYRLAP